jgi:hypothetical protein
MEPYNRGGYAGYSATNASLIAINPARSGSEPGQSDSNACRTGINAGESATNATPSGV